MVSRPQPRGCEAVSRLALFKGGGDAVEVVGDLPLSSVAAICSMQFFWNELPPPILRMKKIQTPIRTMKGTQVEISFATSSLILLL